VQAARVTGADVTRYAELRLAEKAAVADAAPRARPGPVIGLVFHRRVHPIRSLRRSWLTATKAAGGRGRSSTTCVARP